MSSIEKKKNRSRSKRRNIQEGGGLRPTILKTFIDKIYVQLPIEDRNLSPVDLKNKYPSIKTDYNDLDQDDLVKIEENGK